MFAGQVRRSSQAVPRVAARARGRQGALSDTDARTLRRPAAGHATRFDRRADRLVERGAAALRNVLRAMSRDALPNELISCFLYDSNDFLSLQPSY